LGHSAAHLCRRAIDTLDPKPAAPELVPAADWLQIRILLPSGPLVHHPAEASSHHMMLDVKRGALIGKCCLLKTPGVGIRPRTLRVVSLSERALGLQLIQLEIGTETSTSRSKRSDHCGDIIRHPPDDML
jgi:trehalose/maltose hydrolase-like predicted phosphorylase